MSIETEVPAIKNYARTFSPYALFRTLFFSRIEAEYYVSCLSLKQIEELSIIANKIEYSEDRTRPYIIKEFRTDLYVDMLRNGVRDLCRFRLFPNYKNLESALRDRQLHLEYSEPDEPFLDIGSDN